MKAPMVALLIAPDPNMRFRILTGWQTATIREGYRNYRAGRTVMLCCHLDPWCVMADIDRVEHCHLKDVQDYELAGFDLRSDVLSELRRFYPKIDENSEVTVIVWKNIRGTLVDDTKKLGDIADRLDKFFEDVARLPEQLIGKVQQTITEIGRDAAKSVKNLTGKKKTSRKR